MDTREIQKRIDAMPAALASKGVLEPDAEFSINANANPMVLLKWKREKGYTDKHYEFIRATSPQGAIDKADAFIAGMPSAEETKRSQFLEALGRVIDLGDELGQDIGPLVSEMRRLSENAITDQRVAA